MSDLTPTRSLAIALREEHRTLREGFAFLDEKCLLLAGEMLRELRAYRQAVAALAPRLREAGRALAAAIGRHGLDGLQVQPAAAGQWRLARTTRALLGVPLVDAGLGGQPGPAAVAACPSPEARHCAAAHAALAADLAALAARSGNLARLLGEYRRTVRRVRALQDVLLPEAESNLREVEGALEALEQDEAAVLRQVRIRAGIA